MFYFSQVQSISQVFDSLKWKISKDTHARSCSHTSGENKWNVLSVEEKLTSVEEGFQRKKVPEGKVSSGELLLPPGGVIPTLNVRPRRSPPVAH